MQEDMEQTPTEKKPAVKQPGKNKELHVRHATAIAQTVGLSKKELMIQAGYAPSTAASQTSRTRSGKSFTELLDEILPEDEIIAQHEALLKSRSLDHMVFPTGMEDDEIAALLADVNCVLRKVVHSEQAKHAYFWSPDNRARKDALDMLYKLKGKYAPEKIEDVTKYKHLSTKELLERKQAAIAFFKKKKPS